MNRPDRPASHTLTDDPAWTLLGPGSVIHGDLLSAGDLIVHGRVEGVVFAEGTVQIAAGGSVEGGVRARRVVVRGICRGRIEATEQVVLEARCLVQAEVVCDAVTVDPAARFYGSQERPVRPQAPKAAPYQSHSGQA